MSKYLTADEFIVGITGGTQDVAIKGLGTIKIRALSVLDVEKIAREVGGNDVRAGLAMVQYGIVEPALSAEQLQQIEQARPGVIAQISQAVQRLSGITRDAEAAESLENLAGNGS